MFVAWQNGACVCCPTQKQLLKPGAFVNDSRLTVWFSVPSTAVFMRRFGVLNPGMYPRLRLSLFCGEALPLDTAREWALAAPNSLIENIYGPTELTIACQLIDGSMRAHRRNVSKGSCLSANHSKVSSR
jgi:non-ribosomal peptide synthetase component F